MSIQTAVEFAEKENVKLLNYLVLLGNYPGIGPNRKGLVIIHNTIEMIATCDIRIFINEVFFFFSGDRDSVQRIVLTLGMARSWSIKKYLVLLRISDQLQVIHKRAHIFLC